MLSIACRVGEMGARVGVTVSRRLRNSKIIIVK